MRPFKKCFWCLTKTKNKTCSLYCENKYKYYKNKILPTWIWRFYSKYKIYKIIYNYFPKYKKIIFKTCPRKILRFFLKIKKIINYFKYRCFYIEKTKVCNHWIFYISKSSSRRFFKKHFCNHECKKLYEEKRIEALKKRNLAAWGTEYRPNDKIRKIINNKKMAKYEFFRNQNDPAYRLIRIMRKKTKKILKRVDPTWVRKDGVSTYDRLCIKDGKELKEHLESLWKTGMNWNNYGVKNGWVIDHIIPLKHFMENYDIANNIEIQKKAFGKQNLQPLWWHENAKKSAKLNYEME